MSAASTVQAISPATGSARLRQGARAVSLGAATHTVNRAAQSVLTARLRAADRRYWRAVITPLRRRIMAEPRATGRTSEIRAAFDDSSHMQNAVSKLTMNGFDRAELTLPARGHSLDEAGSSADKPVATEEDARQARTLGASTAASAAALAAAGIIVATGGAAAPAV